MAAILIVDDKPINRQLLTTLLGYKGHRLREAGDGAEALELARAEHPDLIITDLLMPTMDGFELVHRLRSDPALAETPVILYTAKYHKWESRDLMQTGGVLHLDKPSEPEVILRAVEQALAAPPSSAVPLSKEFEGKHLRLITDKLSHAVDQIELNHLRLTALGDLSRQLAAVRDPRSVLELGCYGARRLVVAKYALVVMLADDRQSILRISTSGLDQETLTRINPTAADPAPLVRLLDTGRTFRLRDCRAEPDILGLLPDDPGPRSLLFVPSSQHEAALILVEKLGAEVFSADDERLATTLTAQMTLCYENAKLRGIIEQMAKTGIEE